MADVLNTGVEIIGASTLPFCGFKAVVFPGFSGITAPGVSWGAFLIAWRVCDLFRGLIPWPVADYSFEISIARSLMSVILTSSIRPIQVGVNHRFDCSTGID